MAYTYRKTHSHPFGSGKLSVDLGGCLYFRLVLVEFTHEPFVGSLLRIMKVQYRLRLRSTIINCSSLQQAAFVKAYLKQTRFLLGQRHTYRYKCLVQTSPRNQRATRFPLACNDATRHSYRGGAHG